MVSQDILALPSNLVTPQALLEDLFNLRHSSHMKRRQLYHRVLKFIPYNMIQLKSKTVQVVSTNYAGRLRRIHILGTVQYYQLMNRSKD